MQPGARDIAGSKSEAAVRLDWVRDLEAQIARGRAEIERLDAETAKQESAIAERTQLGAIARCRVAANYCEAELEAQLHQVKRSKWVRLGADCFDLGPAVTDRRRTAGMKASLAAVPARACRC